MDRNVIIINMDYLSLGLIIIAIILLVAAAAVLYSAKAKTNTSSRNSRAPRMFGVTFSEVSDELYNPNKINSAIALVWAALVFAIAAAVSVSIKKKALITPTLNSLARRFVYSGPEPAPVLTGNAI